MVQKHFDYTGSARAKHILENWSTEKDNFWKIIPDEYRKALAKLAKEKETVTAPAKDITEGVVVNG